MKYHDPDGNVVSREAWRTLFAHPELRRPVRLVATPHLAVDVIWVGLSAGEGDGALYLVERTPVDEHGFADTLRAKPVGWAPTKRAAIELALAAKSKAEKEELRGEQQD
jgi:hypothetical protein